MIEHALTKLKFLLDPEKIEHNFKYSVDKLKLEPSIEITLKKEHCEPLKEIKFCPIEYVLIAFIYNIIKHGGNSNFSNIDLYRLLNSYHEVAETRHKDIFECECPGIVECSKYKQNIKEFIDEIQKADRSIKADTNKFRFIESPYYEYTNIVENIKCEHERCKSNAEYNIDGKLIPIFCEKHKSDDHINVVKKSFSTENFMISYSSEINQKDSRGKKNISTTYKNLTAYIIQPKFDEISLNTVLIKAELIKHLLTYHNNSGFNDRNPYFRNDGITIKVVSVNFDKLIDLKDYNKCRFDDAVVKNVIDAYIKKRFF
jgi:hypothetical protein